MIAGRARPGRVRDTLGRAVEEVAGHHELTDELLISVIDAAPDGMVVVDDEGTIEFANPMAAQLFGYPVDELVGRPVEILLPEPLRLGHVDYRKGLYEPPAHSCNGLRTRSAWPPTIG